MKDYESFFGGEYLKRSDLNGSVQTWTTSHVQIRKVLSKGQLVDKLVAYFQDKESSGKGLILNITNAHKLRELAGGVRDPDKWGGLRLQIFWDEDVLYGGKRTGGIRLRKPEEPAASATNEPF